MNIYVLYLTNLQLGNAKSSVTMCIHSDTFFYKELLEAVDSYKKLVAIEVKEMHNAQLHIKSVERHDNVSTLVKNVSLHLWKCNAGS